MNHLHPLPGPILAVDVGLKRTGLAICDPQRTVAVGAGQVLASDIATLTQALLQEAERRKITTVLLGLPRATPRGGKEVRARVENLAQRLRQTGLEVVLWDETGTTAQALKERKHYGGKGKQAREWADEAAAILLLESYLDWLNNK